MRRRLLVAAAMLAFAQAGFAQARCVQPDESGLSSHGCYENRFGRSVHSPSRSRNGAVPHHATALCRDGTFSFSRHASGTCSHHGGVKDWE